MVNTFLRFNWFVLLVCSVVACQNISIPVSPRGILPAIDKLPTATTLPTPIDVTPLSTPVNGGIRSHPITITPPNERQWDASPVLVYFFAGPGFTEDSWAWASTPYLVIYRDGTVFRESYSLVYDHVEISLLKGQLTTPQLCALLIKIETDGFFDFPQSGYPDLMVLDAGYTTIYVRAWRQQMLSKSGLGFIVDDAMSAAPNVQLPEGLVRTYMWLTEYVPPNAQSYIPDRGQLWIAAPNLSPYDDSFIQPWTADGISLATLVAEHGTTNKQGVTSVYLELEGETLQEWWSLLGAERVGYFQEGDVEYAVTLRPLLPLESRRLDVDGWDSSGNPQFPSTPREPFDCRM